MKVKVTRKVAEEIEISIPSYRKFNDNYMYKIINEKQALRVCLGEGIGFCQAESAVFESECTAEEFNALFDKEMERLKQLK